MRVVSSARSLRAITRWILRGEAHHAARRTDTRYARGGSHGRSFGTCPAARAGPASGLAAGAPTQHGELAAGPDSGAPRAATGQPDPDRQGQAAPRLPDQRLG